MTNHPEHSIHTMKAGSDMCIECGKVIKPIQASLTLEEILTGLASDARTGYKPTEHLVKLSKAAILTWVEKDVIGEELSMEHIDPFTSPRTYEARMVENMLKSEQRQRLRAVRQEGQDE